MTLKRIIATEHGAGYKTFPQLPFHAATNPVVQTVTRATRDHERDARTYQPSWGVCVIEAMDRIHLMDLNDPTAAY